MRVEQVAIPMMRAVVNRPKLANLLFRFDPWGNPFGEDRYEYPYPIFDRVRADGAVNFRRVYLQWTVVGHEEAKTVFSSNKVIVTPQRETMLAVRPFSQLGENATSFINNLLILIDPPDHTRLRRLVSRAFSPRQIARIEDSVAKLVDVRIAELLQRSGPGREPVDLFEHFTEPLPVNVICELLGIPEERWAWTADISRMISLLGNIMVGFDPKQLSQALDELRSYLLDLAQQRREDPQDDLISELVAVGEDGDRLSDDEFVGMVGLLMFAGHETTSGLLGNSIVALAKHRDQRELIRSTPSLWDNAVEELLRWDSPVQAAARATIEPLEVGGKTIPGGTNVVIFPGGANRDPNFYDDPNVLRLDRPDPQPVSFGHGMHHCLGHALAKMETKIALRGFIEAFGDYTVETDDVTWKRSIVTRGPERLPVRPG